MMSDNRPSKILYFTPQSILPIASSGIQRVVRESAKALLGLASVDFVKWDHVEGQLRYFNAFDCQAFFQSPSWSKFYQPHRYAERRRYRFVDTLPAHDRGSTWLVLPELFYHIPKGELIYRNVMAQAREHGLHTAAMFYDLIPITNSSYREDYQIVHETYMKDLLNVDLILPISKYSAAELERYEEKHFGIDNSARARLGRRISALPLSDTTFRRGQTITRPSLKDRDIIFMLGTVEPRKQQTRVLRVLRDLGTVVSRTLKVVIVGSLHPRSADEFRELLASYPNADYRGYLSDAELEELWSRARFSVFASNDEGFGLPIAESLARGVPCLTANFGSMQEIAEGGGCLLVDVNHDEALAGGLARLAEDDSLIERLQDEISARDERTWGTYAVELLEAIEGYQATFVRSSTAADIADIVEGFETNEGATSWSLRSIRPEGGVAWALGYARGLTAADAKLFAAAVRAEMCDHLALRLIDVDMAGYDEASLETILGADIWSFSTKVCYEGAVQAAADRGFQRLLPSRCLINDTAGAFARAVEELRLQIDRRDLVARREDSFAAACQRDTPEAGVRLSICISTYNRGPFVAENVRWIVSQIAALDGRVRLTVVDNASSDDTADRLAGFSQHPLVTILRNVSNVGMLGNLRVCSTLLEADYTWLIGDDDFITVGAVESVLTALDENRGIPFVFVNFGVYGRVALQPGDSAETLIRDPTLLTTTPSPTGIYRVRDIAIEHDNLFTAIYPIIFRSDILSACFNYPFTGAPFSSLVESIPTTKIILDTYGDVHAVWIADVGIVGNAHNSWQRYRVQWHGMLMPLAFASAREAQIDQKTLHEWSRVHETLFYDAADLFPDQHLADHFDDNDLELSYRVFRKRLTRAS